uniref:Metallo-dependent phosphatase n=1 Tax=Tetraselmis sp. GSL018 TaxID=582737 RepID=A0A061QQ36_9CHLO
MWPDIHLLGGLVGTWTTRSGFCNSEKFKNQFSDFAESFVSYTLSQGLSSTSRAREQRDLPPLRLPAVERLIAVGDLHGDLEKCKRAFKLAGVTDENDHWCAGHTVLVQVGDTLDRGDNEIALNFFLERLEREAFLAGGALYVLNGNHEIMNAGERFKYSTDRAAEQFLQWKAMQHLAAGLKPASSGGAAARRPKIRRGPWPRRRGGRAPAHGRRAPRHRAGGPFARRFLAHRPVALQVGSTVFAHGGVLPDHIGSGGLEQVNQDTKRWLEGSLPESAMKGRRQPPFLAYSESPVWTRRYSSTKKAACDCDALAQALEALPGARRMVVGHTIQDGINAACGDRVYRVDVGMSSGCRGSPPEVLEILNDKVVYRLREGMEPEKLSGNHTDL